MMKSLLSASALALLVATPVAAQQQTDRTANRPAAVETRSDVRIETKENQAQVVQPAGTIDAEKLIGRNIQNPEGDTIGEVSSVLIGRDGQIQAVIVGVGGFLGLGERKVAIDWNDLKVQDNGQTVVASMTKDQLKAMPEFKYAEDVDRDRTRDTARADRATPATRTTAADTTRPATGAQSRAESRDAVAVGRTDTQRPAGNDARVAVVPADRSTSGKTVTTDRSEAGTTVATTAASRDMKLGQMRADEIIGKNVVNARGETVGEVEDIVMDGSKAVHAIVSVGGFLGMGDKDVAIPFDKLKVGQDNAVLMSEASEDQLKQMPAWKKDDKWRAVDRDQPVMGR